ncbi:hypothetical protein EYF80_008996 [Liparis tanakae]|uniref:Uncharacterized protein n=1 Tax=Liparis tanakae TaxID=230148 RepID=A0A4Z2ITX1_9TELE|nr:hypothetical protein EYF80_008996 [Liparis tanakae]
MTVPSQLSLGTKQKAHQEQDKRKRRRGEDGPRHSCSVIRPLDEVSALEHEEGGCCYAPLDLSISTQSSRIHQLQLIPSAHQPPPGLHSTGGSISLLIGAVALNYKSPHRVQRLRGTLAVVEALQQTIPPQPVPLRSQAWRRQRSYCPRLLRQSLPELGDGCDCSAALLSTAARGCNRVEATLMSSKGTIQGGLGPPLRIQEEDLGKGNHEELQPKAHTATQLCVDDPWKKKLLCEDCGAVQHRLAYSQYSAQ